MKLSFGFAKKAEPKRVVAALQVKKDEPAKQMITSLDEGLVKVDAKIEAEKLLTIKCKNPLEAQRAAAKAKAAAAKVGTPAAAKAPTNPDDLDGGLNLSKLSAEDAEATRELLKDAQSGADGGDSSSGVKVMPILMTKGSKRAREAAPPEATRDQFDRVPVESFGEALLRGMGYDPEDHKTKAVFNSTPRDNCLGLGAKALLPTEKAMIQGKKLDGKKPKVAGAAPTKRPGA
mmetsp:Transcript_37640/g.111684  ORF Transcript_37640/g.111684 Transcript_37640/m.111684 type:complete len:232 (-) Transcript_37640:15-710(-)